MALVIVPSLLRELVLSGTAVLTMLANLLRHARTSDLFFCQYHDAPLATVVPEINVS